DATVAFDYVPAVLITCVLVWLAVIAVMVFGVQKGIAGSAMVFFPLLVIMFIILVVCVLLLPAALGGLDAFFRPDWESLLSPPVWVAVYGQFLFCLSLSFGILFIFAWFFDTIPDLTVLGLVVGFSPSCFEFLPCIGVFSALGFMAQAHVVALDEVVES